MPYANSPRLITPRLVLRRFAPEDLPAMLAILGDREVNTFLPLFPINTLEEARAFYEERYAAQYRKGASYQYAICRREEDVPIGYIQLSLEEGHDLGYGLRRDCQGEGFATEAGEALLRRARADGLDYVTATHDVNNPKSGAVMRRLGLTYRYSYKEQWMPKNIPVVFRLYQKNFTRAADWTYPRYREIYPSFVEAL